MVKLIRYELKKLFTDTAAKYVFGIIGIWIIFSVYDCISSFYIYDAHKVNLWNFPYTGLKAVKTAKQKFYNYETDITAETLRNVYYDKIKLEKEFETELETAYCSPTLRNAKMDEVYIKLHELYPEDITVLLNYVNSANINDITKASEAVPDDFYEQLAQARAYSWHAVDNEQEQETIYRYIQKIKTPFKYTYCYGWQMLAQNFQYFQKWLPAGILVLCILILKYETESGMAALNMTFVYGKTKSVYAKIIANLIIVCTIYTVCTLLYSISVLTVLGFKGWDIQIQATVYCIDSIYNINFLQFMILQFSIGLLLAVFTVLFGFFIFSLLQNYIFSGIIALLTVYGITILFGILGNDNSLTKYMISIGSAIFSVSTTFFGTVYEGEFIYFFGYPILRAYGVIIVYGCLSILLIGFSILKYRKIEILN